MCDVSGNHKNFKHNQNECRLKFNFKCILLVFLLQFLLWTTSMIQDNLENNLDNNTWNLKHSAGNCKEYIIQRIVSLIISKLEHNICGSSITILYLIVSSTNFIFLLSSLILWLSFKICHYWGSHSSIIYSLCFLAFPKFSACYVHFYDF